MLQNRNVASRKIVAGKIFFMPYPQDHQKSSMHQTLILLSTYPFQVTGFYELLLCFASLIRNLEDNLLAALKNGDLPEVDRLINLMDPIYSYLDLSKARKEDLKSCVEKWIALGINLDPDTCLTLLRPAIVSGSIETVGALLNRGADINLACSYHKSVLVVAIVYLYQPGLMKMITFLVEKGANIKRSHHDFSPLLVASLRHPDVVPYLVQNGADVNEVGDHKENTPLIAALCYNVCALSTRRCSVAEFLLSAGADPNKPNNDGETALHWASDTEIARLLIQAGADLEARTINGRTPLLAAAYTGKTGVINVLNEHGADMAAVDNAGNSALHALMVKEFGEPQEETCRLFTLHCNQMNKKGMTPLMLAAQRCRTQPVKILLELGADPNIVNWKSRQPHTALSRILYKESRKFDSSLLACAEALLTHNSMTSLPRCSWYFFKMIVLDQCRLVQLMVTRGMAPLSENTWTTYRINHISTVRLPYIPGKLSPLAVALVFNRLAIAQYLIENWFLTSADLVGSMELRQLRVEFERESQADILKFMDENLSQPMSLKKLSFVAVSAQLGGVAGREERVSQTPLPNILKDMLLFRRDNVPMD
ncbi:ankyrin repeat-containing protein [Plakobranchus ocellatus]|uniref:Ankyrin repeat-containing protein n=1 Tax=Plakobranchus ocellatus TaxID=259542 RepID=A0AAV3YMC1_9GAST|nr:ankyrin repeat-containing protein [Plakobranchus ocellatus]